MNCDCWLQVLSKLSPKERRTVRQVSRSCSNLIDYLDRNESSLRIVHYSTRNAHWYGSASTTLEWSSFSFGFTDFKRILSQYPRLLSLQVTGINHLADHHLYSISELCHELTSLEFYSCPYLSEYFHSDFGFHQATQIGWRRLLTGFEQQITRLVLEDCDLDNEHFKLLVDRCKVLEHLNVSNNSQINDYSPLRTHISPHIRVLKVGPKLGVARQQIRALFFTHTLINDIVQSERCYGLLQLQIHCLLSPRLVSLTNKLRCLQRLTLKFACLDGVADGLSVHETDILCTMIVRAPCFGLKHLHFYQINYRIMSDLHWLREQLSTFYGNGWNVSYGIDSTISSLIKSPNDASLKTFMFYSNDIHKIYNQSAVFECVLKRFGNLSLEEFSLSTLKNDYEQNTEASNKFNTVLLNLLKECKNLKSLRLENILPNRNFKQISNMLVECVKNGGLTMFAMSCEQQAVFLEYISSNSIFNYYSDLNKSLSSLVFIGRSTDRQRCTANEVKRLSHRVRREHITQNEWNLRFIMSKNEHPHSQNFAYDDSDSVISNDNDLSDLCQLLDSSLGLIDHMVDLITLCTNYVVIVLTCALMLKPVRLLNSTSAVIQNFVQSKLLRRSFRK